MRPYSIGFVFLLVLLLAPGLSMGQLVINEIMSVNTSVIADEDDSFQDWIELYNAGTEPVNLEGYGLSDDPSFLFKWVFNKYILDPGAYMLVWASSKDRKPPKDGLIPGMIREMYSNIQGVTIAELTAHPSFPDHPNKRTTLNNFFEAPRNIGDNYGQRIAAWLEPPVTGHYSFWISGDDECELWLSTNESPGNVQKIATVPFWTNIREWNKFPQQKSNPILLETGKRYYIMTLMKEGGGGDHVAVRWQWPSGKIEEPLEVTHCRIHGGMQHTNFQISKGGEAITLTHPDGTIVDQVPATPLPVNISYARNPNGTGPFLLSDTPTPGMLNTGEGFMERLSPPVILTPSGSYADSVLIIMTASPPEAEIYYTLNGNIPTNTNGMLYTGPFALKQSASIRAIAFMPQFLSSSVAGATYNILAKNLEDFSSNLPLMIINQYNIPISPSDKSIAYLTLVDKPQNGRFNLLDQDVFQSRIDIEIRGSSSQSFPKKGFGFHLYNEDDTNNKKAILGMPEDHNWVLHGPYSDKSLARNSIAYEVAREMDGWHPRSQFVELFMHDGNGPVSNEHYHGVYLLVERIKVAEGRLDLAELEPHHNAEPEISGGYIFKKDRLNEGESGILFKRGMRYAYVRPQEDRISIPQRDWLKQYLDAFDDAIMGNNAFDPETGYRRFIEPASFIDHHLITELFKQIDGYRLSTFLYKDRNGKINLGPVWDYNLSWGNADYLNGWQPTGWYYELLGQNDYLDGWFTRLFADPEFVRQYKKRYVELRRNVFSADNIIGKLREKENLLAEAAVRNFQRWPVMGQWVWPNWYVATSHADEINWMEQWMLQRLAWMDGMLSDTSEVIHYWNFNNTNQFATPSYTIGGAEIIIDPSMGAEITTGTGQGFTGVNARFGDPVGAHLRVNNPIGTKVTFVMPTKNFEKIQLAYETRRSASGSNRQYLSYTLDGTNYLAFDTLIVTENPTLYQWDLTDSLGVTDNPQFAVRIWFNQVDDGTGGSSGNNRIDNITLDGVLMDNVNLPPDVVYAPDVLEAIASEGEKVLDLNALFDDPDGDPLVFSVVLQDQDLASLFLDDGNLTIIGLKPGSDMLKITADDGVNFPVTLSFPLLIYPAAHVLMDADFRFEHWSQEAPEGTFPENMIFLQSAKNDPELLDGLYHSYFIPYDDYAAGDISNIGFPYKNQSRTRINGLEEEGISFINTGRSRDLGAAVVNINTTDVDSLYVSWTGGTLRANSRVYHLRLQTRDGLEGDWEDVLDDANEPIEYVRYHEDNHEQLFERIVLSESLLNRPNIFIRWKYYFTGFQLDPASGQRDQLRLDDIFITKQGSNGIAFPANNKPIVAFPNPSVSGIFHLNRNVHGFVVDMLGRPIVTLQGQHEIDLMLQPSGMYILMTEEGQVVRMIRH